MGYLSPTYQSNPQQFTMGDAISMGSPKDVGSSYSIVFVIVLDVDQDKRNPFND
jgi:hypothetical protein